MIPDYDMLMEVKARDLCGVFGGVTNPAIGSFEGASKGIQSEEIRVMEFFCTEAQLSKNEGFLWELLSKMWNSLNQETPACSTNGRMVLISQG